MNAKLSAENPDWLSPLAVVEAAHRVMGGIDVDPASDGAANLMIGATTFFTEDDNGLYDSNGPERVHRAWIGRVFLNPPGGMTRAFWTNLLRNYLLGNCTEAIWVGFSIEQLHSLQSADYSQFDDAVYTSPLHYPMCVPKARLRFGESDVRKESRMAIERMAINALNVERVAAGKKPSRRQPKEKPASPTHGNYITYLGPNVEGFIREFSLIGACR